MIKVNNFDTIVSFIEKTILHIDEDTPKDLALAISTARFKVQILLREKDGHKFGGATGQRFLTIQELKKKKSSLIREAEAKNGRLSINLSPIDWRAMASQQVLITQQRLNKLTEMLAKGADTHHQAESLESIIGDWNSIPFELSAADRKTDENNNSVNNRIQKINSLKKLIPDEKLREQVVDKMLGSVTSKMAFTTSMKKNPTHIRGRAYEMLDIDDPLLLESSIEIFSNMTGLKKEEFFIVPSKSGYHAIFNNNYDLSKVKVSENFKGRRYTFGDGRAVFDLKPDAETILYYNDTCPFKDLFDMKKYIENLKGGFVQVYTDHINEVTQMDWTDHKKRHWVFYSPISKQMVDSIIEECL